MLRKKAAHWRTKAEEAAVEYATAMAQHVADLETDLADEEEEGGEGAGAGGGAKKKAADADGGYGGVSESKGGDKGDDDEADGGKKSRGGRKGRAGAAAVAAAAAGGKGAGAGGAPSLSTDELSPAVAAALKGEPLTLVTPSPDGLRGVSLEQIHQARRVWEGGGGGTWRRGTSVAWRRLIHAPALAPNLRHLYRCPPSHSPPSACRRSPCTRANARSCCPRPTWTPSTPSAPRTR
jgi:hypothetical protein